MNAEAAAESVENHLQQALQETDADEKDYHVRNALQELEVVADGLGN
jgi:hypothetical protein